MSTNPAGYATGSGLCRACWEDSNAERLACCRPNPPPPPPPPKLRGRRHHRRSCGRFAPAGSYCLRRRRHRRRSEHHRLHRRCSGSSEALRLPPPPPPPTARFREIAFRVRLRRFPPPPPRALRTLLRLSLRALRLLLPLRALREFPSRLLRASLPRRDRCRDCFRPSHCCGRAACCGSDRVSISADLCWRLRQIGLFLIRLIGSYFLILILVLILVLVLTLVVVSLERDHRIAVGIDIPSRVVLLPAREIDQRRRTHGLTLKLPKFPVFNRGSPRRGNAISIVRGRS